MKRVMIELSSRSVLENCVNLVEIPDNKDNMNLIVFRKENKLYAWLNACPHDGRKLCKDPDLLLNKKKDLFQCMNHQALFDYRNGLCKDGPCEGEYLMQYPIIEENSTIKVFEKNFEK